MPALNQTTFALLIVAAGALAGLAVFAVLWLVLRLLPKSAVALPRKLFLHGSGALRLFLPLLGIHIAFKSVETSLPGMIGSLTGIVLIGTGAWLAIRFVHGAEEFVEARLGLDKPDNLDARRTVTQLRVLRSVLIYFIAFTAIIVGLLFLPGARQIGTGLLASAGLAGLVVGFAAQRALGNLLAGFQIAITQPIRLDDVVVVEGEWGNVEEITLTYVVIRIWDQRRLILPISYFLEKPFTNWTRQDSQILGTVFIYADYSVPIDALRAELDRIVTASKHWDGRVKGLVVTDSKEKTLELRALVSASDGGEAWNLRCEVREGLVQFLQREYPEALPRFRAELTREAATV